MDNFLIPFLLHFLGNCMTAYNTVYRSRMIMLDSVKARMMFHNCIFLYFIIRSSTLLNIKGLGAYSSIASISLTTANVYMCVCLP